MACNLTQGFTLDCKNSAGGISTIYVAPFSQKGNLTISSGSVSNAGSILISGSAAQFLTYALRKATSQAKETYAVNEANGTLYYEPEVDIVLTKSEVNKRNELILLAQQSVMIIVKDHTNVTGSYILYGTDAGLDMSGDQSTGKAYGDLNGYTLKFTGKEMYPGVYLPSGSLAAQLLPA